jgi:hypothetical protein
MREHQIAAEQVEGFVEPLVHAGQSAGWNKGGGRDGRS